MMSLCPDKIVNPDNPIHMSDHKNCESGSCVDANLSAIIY